MKKLHILAKGMTIDDQIYEFEEDTMKWIGQVS